LEYEILFFLSPMNTTFTVAVKYGAAEVDQLPHTAFTDLI